MLTGTPCKLQEMKEPMILCRKMASDDFICFPGKLASTPAGEKAPAGGCEADTSISCFLLFTFYALDLLAVHLQELSLSLCCVWLEVSLHIISLFRIQSLL
jgi:hypothetical protein